MPKSTQPSVFCCESLRELYRLQPNAQKSISFRALTLREESGGLSNCPCAIFFFLEPANISLLSLLAFPFVLLQITLPIFSATLNVLVEE